MKRHAEQDELDRLYGDVQALLARERGVRAYMRARSTEMRWLFALTLPLGSALSLAWLAPREDLDAALHEPLPGFAAVLLLCLAAVLTRLLRPLHLPESAPRQDALLGWFALAAPALLAFLPGPLGTYAEPERDCLLIGLLLGGAQIMWLRALLRQRSAVRTDLLLSAAGGLCANLALILHCPGTAKLHGLLVHASIAVWLLLLLHAGRRLRRAP